LAVHRCPALAEKEIFLAIVPKHLGYLLIFIAEKNWAGNINHKNSRLFSGEIKGNIDSQECKTIFYFRKSASGATADTGILGKKTTLPIAGALC
jgi:hypothetical protein